METKFITILPRFRDYAPRGSVSQLFLIWDWWNDYGYRTLFEIVYIDENSKKHDIGTIKIGFYGQKETQINLKAGESFERLPDDHFSLVSADYYEELNNPSPLIREKILSTLNDIAKYSKIYEKVILENVTQISLLRGISQTEVLGQLRRMANGGNKLTPYNFKFERKLNPGKQPPIILSFNVLPETSPPTNSNVLIGRNGTGKTTLLHPLWK